MASSEPPFIDTPTDLLCHKNNTACTSAAILGVMAGIVFPIVSMFGIPSNFIIFYVFTFRWTAPSRSTIYLSWLALADNFCLVVMGWLWMFPAKGLPYITGGRVAFFTFAQSDSVCRIHRYFFAFAPSLTTNLLLLTVLDRTLSIYFPFKWHYIPVRRARQAVGVVFLITAVLSLPFGVNVGWAVSNGQRTCWILKGVVFFEVLNILIANNGLVQTLGVVILNIAMVWKLHSLFKIWMKLKAVRDAEFDIRRRDVSISVIVIALSCLFLTGAVLQATGYLLAFLFRVSHAGPNLVRKAYNISDIGWQIFFIQESLSWFIYMRKMHHFRSVVTGMYKNAIKSLHNTHQHVHEFKMSECRNT